ncbi:MAG: cytochrome P450 [Paracoccaceae bacterium]
MTPLPLPPGPTFGLPQKIAYARDPVGFIARASKRYGSTFTMRNMIGTVVMTTDPSDARDILSAPRQTYGVSTVKLLSPLLGRNSLILTDGSQHLKDRKTLMPHFNGAALAKHRTRICRIAAEEADNLRHDPVKMQDVMQSVSLRVIIETIFGATDPVRVQTLIKAVKARIAASNPLLVFMPALRRGVFGLSPWDRFCAASKQLEGQLMQEIAHQRQSNQGESILARLVASGEMTDREICDQLVTLLLAGHDTTASATAWAFAWLQHDPALLDTVKQSLRAQGDDHEALMANQHLEEISLETLRLSPVIPDIVRFLKEPLQVGNKMLPAGVNVGICTTLIQRDPSLFPDPLVFQPARWREMSANAQNFLPFGGGSRKCIGAAFALQEMQLILGTFLSRLSFKPQRAPVARPLAVRNHFTMGPKGGVPVAVT